MNMMNMRCWTVPVVLALLRSFEAAAQPTPELDARVREKFAATHLALSRAVPDEWRASP